MENHEKLSELYRIAESKNIVKSKGEFAELLGTTQGTLSSCLNGKQKEKYDGTCANLVAKAESLLARQGVIVTDGQYNITTGANYGEQKNFGTSSEDLRYIVDKLLGEIEKTRSQMDAQREHYERLLMAAITKQ